MSVHRHHRKLRSQGGDDSPENILYVTESFHRWIHANPGISYARGWLVKSWENPAEIPVEPHPELRLSIRDQEAA